MNRGVRSGTREKSEPKLESKFDRLFDEVGYPRLVLSDCKIVQLDRIK